MAITLNVFFHSKNVVKRYLIREISNRKCAIIFSGASTFPGLRKFIVEQSKTRVRCLLHIALHGLAASGCAGGGNDSFKAFGLQHEKTFII